MNEIVWPKRYEPGTTDNCVSSEIIVAGLTAADVWPCLNTISVWPTCYSNISDMRLHGCSGSELRASRGLRLGGAYALALAILWTGGTPLAFAADELAATNIPARLVSSPGICFLWTAQSQQVAFRLKSDKDFVDLVLGPGKLDVFQKVKPPLRVACIARSLEKNESRPFAGIKETIDLLRQAGVPPERVLLAYNPEGQPGTPSVEFRDLVSSSRRAKQMAQAYGAPLLIGPGLRDMQGREDLYPDLAKNCDFWMIQSQRLQFDESTREPVAAQLYRERVKRIVRRLREGNPTIRIYVQVVTTAARGTATLSAEQIAGYARSVDDLVDGVRIYGASAELLSQVIDRLRGPSPTPAESENP